MKKVNIINAVGMLTCLSSYSLFAANETSVKPDETIEVIKVTAQKHPQAVEDIAISVSVISGRTLDEQNIKDTTALSAQSPNFKITPNANEGSPPAVNIRGVGSMDYNTSTTSPVGMYLDDVAGGSANSQLINLFDIEAIEILRGPQGTLFGRNTTAGAVLIRSKRPTHSFSGGLTAGFGLESHKKLEGILNVPVSDNVATRLAFSHQDYDYSSNNLHPIAPVSGMQQQMWRLSVLGEWDDIEMFAKVHSESWDGIVQPNGHSGVVKGVDSTGDTIFCSAQEAGSSLCTDAFGFNDGSDNFHDVRVNNDVNGNSPHKTDSWGADIHLNVEFNDQFHLESISSYNTLDRIHFYNCDSSSASLCEGGQDVYTDVYTQELRLHFDMDKLYIIGGLYYMDESLTQDNFLDVFRDFRAVPPLFSFAATTFYDNQIDITSFSAFAHSEYKINDKTTFTAGLRYTDESTDYRAVGTHNVPLAVNDQIGLVVPGWDVAGSVEDDNLSGKLALNHKYSNALVAFASYARGYKSGGYNGASVTNEAEAIRNDYGAETLDAYELGVRINWDQKNANLNLATFYYDYQNQQVFMNQQTLDPSAPPTQLLNNVGNSAIYGAEADLAWQISSSTGLKLSAGYLPEANLESFVNTAGVEIRDNRLPYTSKWNVSGLAEYVFDLSSAEVIFQLNFDYQSEFYFDQNQSAYTKQEGFTVWNTSLAYERDNWRLSLWGKNITDKEYYHWKLDLRGFLNSILDNKGPSRQFGVDLSYSF